VTKWNCDPSPEPYNVLEQARGNAEIFVSVRWTWDGVSVYPNCAGPLLNARLQNVGSRTWYAHFLGRKGTPQSVPVPPGTDVTASAAFLAGHGLATLADLDGFHIDLDP
jgi:hypothetical protein